MSILEQVREYEKLGIKIVIKSITTNKLILTLKLTLFLN